MPELDHHPEPVSLHDCAVCQDRGIEVESREYCQACYRGKRRKNMDSFADKLRSMPFTDAMWIVAHATIQSERAIAAADLALLKAKLLQAERELAEVRKDAERWDMLKRSLRTNYIPGAGYGRRFKIIEICTLTGDEKEFQDFIGSIDAASVAQANKEPKE
jgi:hypothetical protein